jgi:hypothetical protein
MTNVLPPAAGDNSPHSLGTAEAIPVMEWSSAWMQFLIDSRHSPLEAGLAWQQAVGALQKKAWSNWMGRFAGGTASAA